LATWLGAGLGSAGVTRGFLTRLLEIPLDGVKISGATSYIAVKAFRKVPR